MLAWLHLLLAATVLSSTAYAADPTVADLILAVRAKATTLESSSGMQSAYKTTLASYRLTPADLTYSDFAVARLLFEATRDAGFWNLHWTITNLEPVSDNIWKQWNTVSRPSPLAFTASAECDELSALLSFLATRAGIKGIGLFWPYPNHTIAVWEIRPAGRHPVRINVPTTQIFLMESDFFGTKTFDPWKQKSIFDYRRRDVPDTFPIPRPLFDFFLRQVDRYAGASNTALQRLRYLREGVFLRSWTPSAAAQSALRMREDKGVNAEDSSAYWNFAEDMRTTQN